MAEAAGDAFDLRLVGGSAGGGCTVRGVISYFRHGFAQAAKRARPLGLPTFVTAKSLTTINDIYEHEDVWRAEVTGPFTGFFVSPATTGAAAAASRSPRGLARSQSDAGFLPRLKNGAAHVASSQTPDPSALRKGLGASTSNPLHMNPVDDGAEDVSAAASQTLSADEKLLRKLLFVVEPVRAECVRRLRKLEDASGRAPSAQVAEALCELCAGVMSGAHLGSPGSGGVKLSPFATSSYTPKQVARAERRLRALRTSV
ncbi:MAG: hypothetical protein ACPIOQ_74640, partial [Promethearchaeia archaeon]